MNTPLSLDDAQKTIQARRATALHGMELALAAIPLIERGCASERLFVLNAALDAFSSGMFDLAVELARDAIDDGLHVSTAEVWKQETYTLASARQRLQSVARGRLH